MLRISHRPLSFWYAALSGHADHGLAQHRWGAPEAAALGAAGHGGSARRLLRAEATATRSGGLLRRRARLHAARIPAAVASTAEIRSIAAARVSAFLRGRYRGYYSRGGIYLGFGLPTATPSPITTTIPAMIIRPLTMITVTPGTATIPATARDRAAPPQTSPARLFARRLRRLRQLGAESQLRAAAVYRSNNRSITANSLGNQSAGPQSFADLQRRRALSSARSGRATRSVAVSAPSRPRARNRSCTGSARIEVLHPDGIVAGAEGWRKSAG